MNKIGKKKRSLRLQNIRDETVYPVQELNRIFDNTDILAAVGASNLTAATYYACMLIRCNALAKIPFKIYKSDGDGAEQITNHPLRELIKFRPNPFMSAHDFLWATEFQRIEYGNAFWVYDFQGGNIKALYPLYSPKVQIIIDDESLFGTRNAVYYLYTDAKKGKMIYPAEKILHFKNFAANGIVGKPIKHYLYDVIMQEKYAQSVIKERYKKGLQDPIIVTYIGDLNSDKKSKIQKKFESMGGVQNAGKVIPIPSDFDIKTLQTNLVSNQFFELNGLTTRHIANAYGVKSFQLNDMEKSTYSNITEQNKAFYSDTMQNVLTCYEQEMTYKLLTSADRANGIFIEANADVMLRTDLLTRMQAYREAVGSGIMQIAEARRKENLKFIPGTDRLLMANGAAIWVDDLGKQYKLQMTEVKTDE
ncbi:MAG: phage portal protein [Clostridia bacterium]|nr:phage portal protein [Clostridia bacterium]